MTDYLELPPPSSSPSSPPSFATPYRPPPLRVLSLVFDIVLGIGVALVLIGSVLPAIDAASVAASAASPTPGSYGYDAAAAGGNRAAAMGRTAIYLWVRLFGYLMVVTAAIVYIQPNETRTRRVTGAVLICGVVLLSFMMLAPNSAMMWMQQMLR